MVYIKLLELDDIIFGSTRNEMCPEFEKMMHKKFQMSSMGELTFFLRLQVTQKDDGIFFSQDKYMDEILKKFSFSTMKTASTPMETSKPLLKDAEAEDVDVHLYRSMIGSLMYLTASRPDIMFAVCACARFQVTPKVSHLHAVKRIFRYLKGQPKLGLWYPKDSPFDLEAYSESDYAGASLDRKSITEGCQFLRSRLISCERTICIVKNLVFHSKTKHIEIRHHFIKDSNKKNLIHMIKIHTDRNATSKATTVNGEVQIQALVDVKKVIVTETSVRRALQLKDAEGTECLPNATIFAELERIGAKTIAWNEFSSIASIIICLATNQKFKFSKYIFDNMVKNLEGGVKFLMFPREKEKGFSGRVTPLFQTMMVQAQEEGEGSEMPTVPQHTSTINQPSSSQPPKKQKPRNTKKQNTEASQPSDPIQPMADETENVESVPIHSNDPLLSGEDRLKLNELLELCTKLFERVLDLENTKTYQAIEITKLKERVKKLERRNKSSTPGLKRLRKVGRTARIESSEDKGLGDQEDASKQGRKIADLDADAEVTLVDEAQERIDDNLMFDTRVFYEQEVEVEKVVSTAKVTTVSATLTTVDELTLAQTLIEIKEAKPKPVTTATTTTTTAVKKPLKKKDQILVDEEVAQRLQEELQAELEEEERLARQKEEEDNLIS
ncbi:uncharacterized mitochondrial protein-like protein [Tanacetum coccineum]